MNKPKKIVLKKLETSFLCKWNISPNIGSNFSFKALQALVTQNQWTAYSYFSFLLKANPCPGYVDVYISQPESWRLEGSSSEAFVSPWNMVVKHPVIKPGNKATT